MLTKGQMQKYSEVLLWGLKTARKGKYKKGDIVLLRFGLAAVKMAEVLQGKLLEMGLIPVLRAGSSPAMEHNFYEMADRRQLTFVGPWEKELSRHMNGSIFLHAPDSLTHLADLDSRKIGQAAVARKPLRDLLREREDQGKYGWTLCTIPTPELAKHAGLSLKQYTRQVVRACYLDKPDPVGAWRGIYRDAMQIKNWLNSMEVKHYLVESENIDLRIKPGRQRKWVGISGHNIPSFELFLSPDWRGTQGRYYADQPSFRTGNHVKGVDLTFRKGVVVEASARKGGEFLKRQLAMDSGAKKVGEFSLTDKRFSRINRFMANTLFDENYGGRHGNCHLAVGSSYTDTFDGDPAQLTKETKRKLGFNDSALHWDLVNTEKKTVTAHLSSGKRVVIYDNGVFTY